MGSASVIEPFETLALPSCEWLVAVAPLEDRLMLEMLRYADELREPAEYYDDVPTAKPDKEMVDLAVQLIEKTDAFDLRDSRITTALRLSSSCRKKFKGHKIIAHHEERPHGGNVVDLMEARKQSWPSLPPNVQDLKRRLPRSATRRRVDVAS
jgi:DNA end-binding protein Ku